MRILKIAIGINDLNILDSSISVVSEGRIIGHEDVGIIEEVGSEVSNFKKDYCVLISSVTSCGNCENCKKLMYSHRATHIVNICHEFAVKVSWIKPMVKALIRSLKRQELPPLLKLREKLLR